MENIESVKKWHSLPENQRTMNKVDLDVIKTALTKLRFITNKSNEGISIASIELKVGDFQKKSLENLILLLRQNKDIDIFMITLEVGDGNWEVMIRSHVPSTPEKIAGLFNKKGFSYYSDFSVNYEQKKALNQKVKNLFLDF